MLREIVVDLGDSDPEGRQARLLLQGGPHALLHLRQLALRITDLVAPVRGANHPVPVLRILPEGAHAGGDPPHGPHQQPMKAEIDQGRGNEGDEERESENPVREGDHGLPQGRLVEHEVDQGFGIPGRGADDPQDPPGRRQQGAEGVANQHDEAGLAQVVSGVDVLGRHVHQHELARRPAWSGPTVKAPAWVKQLAWSAPRLTM